MRKYFFILLIALLTSPFSSAQFVADGDTFTQTLPGQTLRRADFNPLIIFNTESGIIISAKKFR